MQWELVSENNAELNWTKQLIALRKNHRALRIGNFRAVTANRLLAFERYTDRADETRIVIVNPSPQPVTERILMASSKLMNEDRFVDVLSGDTGKEPLRAAILKVSLPPYGMVVLRPIVEPFDGYTPYKRVQ
jgi:cyclomaltodextrinase / maltogenic alpha-amylase / neopullulanase